MSEAKPPSPSASEAPNAGRRSLLHVLVGGIAAAISGLLGVPLAGYALSPVLRRDEGEALWIPVGAVAEFSEARVARDLVYRTSDGWLQAQQRERVIVGRTRADEFVVFSTRCTHFGCGVEWDAERQEFRCPCHGGVFNAEGVPIAGPPKEPLIRLESRVHDGRLEVKKA